MRMIVITPENWNGMKYFKTEVYENGVLTQSYYQFDKEGIKKDIEMIQRPGPVDEAIQFRFQLAKLLMDNQISISC